MQPTEIIHGIANILFFLPFSIVFTKLYVSKLVNVSPGPFWKKIFSSKPLLFGFFALQSSITVTYTLFQIYLHLFDRQPNSKWTKMVINMKFLKDMLLTACMIAVVFVL